MSLRDSYTLLAPLYDSVVARASAPARRRSLAMLPQPAGTYLIAGVGSGLDLPLLPTQHRYVGLDLTPAMLHRALPRAQGCSFAPVLGDAMRLPFASAAFDGAILHLILAVVPNPAACLREAARVVRPGGELLVLDKFIPAGRRALLRRLLSPLTARFATRLDVVFEDLLATTPGLSVIDDQPAAAAGWFRHIRLRRCE